MQRRTALSLLASIPLVAACSGPGDTPTPSRGASIGGFPVTIESALGSTTISRAPERVVCLGWGSQDAALALDVVPVGMQDMAGNTGDDTKILPWNTAELGGAEPTLIAYTTDDVPYEQIAGLRPDAILAVNSGLDADQFGKLNALAPTVAYPGKPWLTGWQDQIRMVGQALGRTDQAGQLERRTVALINRAKDDHPEYGDTTVAFGSGTQAQSYNLYLASDSRVQLLQQLGFTVSPSVPTKAASFAAQVSLEELDRIDTDVLVSWYLSSQVQQSLEDNKVFQAMPAVRRNGYVALTDPALVYATSAVTVLSLPWMLDRYLPLLSAAAKGQAS